MKTLSLCKEFFFGWLLVLLATRIYLNLLKVISFAPCFFFKWDFRMHSTRSCSKMEGYGFLFHFFVWVSGHQKSRTLPEKRLYIPDCLIHKCHTGWYFYQSILFDCNLLLPTPLKFNIDTKTDGPSKCDPRLQQWLYILHFGSQTLPVISKVF